MAQSLECELLWAHLLNKPEFSNSQSAMLGFSITGFCNTCTLCKPSDLQNPKA